MKKKYKELNKRNLIKAIKKGILPTEKGCCDGFGKHKQHMSRFVHKNNIDVKAIRKEIHDKFFA